MRWSTWCGLVYGVALLAVDAHAQILQPTSDVRENYVKTRVYCGDPIEINRSPSAQFSAFDDTTNSFLRACTLQDIAEAQAIQQSWVRGDSIWIYEDVYASVIGPSPLTTAVARSDAAIGFHIDAGQQCQCYYRVDLTGTQEGSGMGLLRSSLSKLGSGDSVVVASVGRTLGPLPGHLAAVLDRNLTLHAGDYVLDVHVDAEDGFLVFGAIIAELDLYNMTTIAPTTWGRVKTLYR
jgi:hypothetical protein